MSIQNLFSSNDFNLFAKSITLNGGSILSSYITQTITINMSGIWANPQPCPIVFSRIGNICTATFASVSFVATTSNVIQGTIVAPAFIPSQPVTAVIAIRDNGVNIYTGFCQLNNSGGIIISDEGGNYAGSGQSGFYQFTIVYPVANI